MGRCFYGLVVSAALVLGCASAAPPEQVQQSTVGDLGDGDGFAGASDFAGQQCVDGVDCMTGNPGSCAAGKVVCQGSSLSCVPASTTQSCYSGPAATRDIGTCKSGMQTCIGSLGACGGEVLPAAVENCFNDLDDDCDGKVNNGCPDHFITGTPRVLGGHGLATGGSAFSLRCPANSFLTKITFFGDNPDQYLSGLDIFCGTPTLVRGASSYSVTIAAVTATPASIRGVTTAADTSTFDCGTTGLIPGWWTTGVYDNSPGGLDKLGMFCGSTALTLSATNQLSLTMTKQGTGTPAGYAGLNPVAFEDDCLQGEVLIGYEGRHGNYFDFFQAVCAPLQTVYK
ncbi:MAG: hypothetical protein JWN44_6567 [Myxococcales bacterium]|nr:hypothetical protein [Myxococcales bacterium]